MKITRTLGFTGLLVIGGLLSWMAGPTSAQAAPKRVLVVTVTKGFRHSSIPTSEKVLADLAQKDGSFTVDFARNDDELKAKMTPEALQKYDGVIFASTTGVLPLPDKTAFLNWIRSGKAFIGTHAATDTFHAEKTTEIDPYIEMIGGEFSSHYPGFYEVECINQDPAHPATKAIGNSYLVTDEIYILKNFFRDRVHGLLTLDQNPKWKNPGDYPIAWCKEYGAGKVFYTSLGHREEVWESPEYQKHIVGGIKWALGLEKGDAKPQSLAYEVSKEEKEEGFKPLFSGTDLKGWHLRNDAGRQSWIAQNSMLINSTLAAGKPLPGTDLVSDEKFRDFTVRYEYMVPSNSNSGFYLQGRYEVQILDDFAKGKAELGGNGAIYQLAPVSQFVSKKPGAWQTVEATIRDSMITVTLNGVKVHDNVKVEKATGGELDGNVNEPGPIMLQGDHGSVAFRNMRIKTLK